MNSETAKTISIKHYLERKGILPDTTIRGVAKYRSPLREETKPSFHVNLSKNLWYDFGIGQGGSIIDLCILLETCDFKTALNILSSMNLPHIVINKNQNSENKLIIKSIKPIQHKALIKYLQARKIPFSIAKIYLKEVIFNVGTTQYFALGFKNKKGGYELRSKYFKGSSSPKYYTLIRGENHNTINLFEGFFDFLSALTYYNLIVPNNRTIILNSLTFLKDIQPLLENAHTINAYLDNDNAGEKALIQLKREHSCLNNRSLEIYSEYSDFNEFIKSKKAQQSVEP